MLADREAYHHFRIARLIFSAPWVVAGECICDWWTNRILLFENVEYYLQELARELG